MGDIKPRHKNTEKKPNEFSWIDLLTWTREMRRKQETIDFMPH